MTFALSLAVSILLIFLLIFVFAVAMFVSIVKMMFGFGTTKRKPRANASDSGTRRSEWSGYKASGENKEKKVIFDKDEGEYVDFEEIKEN